MRLCFVCAPAAAGEVCPFSQMMRARLRRAGNWLENQISPCGALHTPLFLWDPRTANSLRTFAFADSRPLARSLGGCASGGIGLFASKLTPATAILRGGGAKLTLFRHWEKEAPLLLLPSNSRAHCEFGLIRRVIYNARTGLTTTEQCAERRDSFQRAIIFPNAITFCSGNKTELIYSPGLKVALWRNYRLSLPTSAPSRLHTAEGVRALILLAVSQQ